MTDTQTDEHEEPAIMSLSDDSVSRLREGWLRIAGVMVIDQVLNPAGFTTHAESGEELAGRVRFTCGWPSKGGLARKRQVLGECWSMFNSVNHNSEIFISPTIENPIRALDILTHELGHAALGPKAKHNRGFKKFCDLVGLEGKPTATVAGEDLTAALQKIVDVMPAYPHGKLVGSPKVTQTTRDRKAYCANDACPSMEEDGFKIRLTKKWMQRYAVGPLDESGLPEFVALRCPDCGRQMSVERPNEDDDPE